MVLNVVLIFATRESTARKAAQLQVRKPYQNVAKTYQRQSWRRLETYRNRIEIVSSPYPNRKPSENRNRKDYASDWSLVLLGPDYTILQKLYSDDTTLYYARLRYTILYSTLLYTITIIIKP